MIKCFNLLSTVKIVLRLGTKKFGCSQIIFILSIFLFFILKFGPVSSLLGNRRAIIELSYCVWYYTTRVYA